MDKVFSLGVRHDGSKLNKLIQILFDTNGMMMFNLHDQKGNSWHGVNLSNSIALAVALTETQIVEIEGKGKVEAKIGGIERACLLKTIKDIPEEHAKQILTLIQIPENEKGVMVSEAPPEGVEHEYFFNVQDEAFEMMAEAIKSLKTMH